MLNSHGVSELYYHFVFVTKYRQHFDYFPLPEELKIWLADSDSVLIEYGIQKDHIHMAVELKPDVSPSAFARAFKDSWSFHFGQMYDSLWPGWRRGFFVKSISNASMEAVKKYIKEQ